MNSLLKNNKLIREEAKKAQSLERFRVYCPTCGHSMLLVKQDKTICSWCGKYVFKNKKIEFEYRLKEQMLHNN